MNEQTGFSKKESICIKGFAILFMLFHHCFLSPGRYEGYTFSFSPFTELHVNYIARFFKICVAMYVFVSAYGLTTKLKNMKFTVDNVKEFILKNYTKLMLNFFLIYIFSFIANILYGNNILEIYKSENIIGSISYIIIDFFGLASLFKTATINVTWWYMSLANIIIFVIPLIYYIYKKVGFLPLFIIAMLILHSFQLTNTDMLRWLATIILGMHFAEKDLFSKKITIKKDKWGILIYLLKFIFFTFILFMLFIIRTKTHWKLYELHDTFIPIYMIWYLLNFIIPLRGVSKVSGFLGKYSMDIFLTHSFIRYYFFQDFTYSFGNAFEIYFILVVISLGVAIVIGLIKKIIHFDKFIEFVQKKIVIWGGVLG